MGTKLEHMNKAPGMEVLCVEGSSYFTKGRVYRLTSQMAIEDDQGDLWGPLGDTDFEHWPHAPLFVPAPENTEYEEASAEIAEMSWNASDADVADQETLAEASRYPDDNPKTRVGLSKPSLSCVPPVSLYHMGQAMADGKEKYGLMNWREKTVSSSIYVDATMRHLMAWWDGEERASDSGVHHLAHAMACMAIVLDAQSVGKLNDDRPSPGNLPAFLQANTEELS